MPAAPLPALLSRWLTAGLHSDRRSRLSDAGLVGDKPEDLDRIYVDLRCAGTTQGEQGPCRQEGSAISTLLQGDGPGHLLVGGPGAGKSTVTAMLAQVGRAAWLLDEGEPDVLAVQLRDLAARQAWDLRAARAAFPLRLDLPWLAQRCQRLPDAPAWRHVAEAAQLQLRPTGWTEAIDAEALREAVQATGPILWILDGLDEVPNGPGRDAVLKCAAALRRPGDRRVVATRPQGYRGEEDALSQLDLLPMNSTEQGQLVAALLRTLTAEAGEQERAEERIAESRRRADLQSLLEQPLLLTLVVSLILYEGDLPSARAQLFDNFFSMSWKRELRKKRHSGLVAADEADVRALHTRAALALHSRADGAAGAAPGLGVRALRALAEGVYAQKRLHGPEARRRAQRLVDLATERLVLLLHDEQGKYRFPVMSLQEHFAAKALLNGEDLRPRLAAIAQRPHWEGVLGLMASHLATTSGESADQNKGEALVALCRGLNAGELGEGPRRLFLGSQVALNLLEETQSVWCPWLQEPLWEVAREGVRAPWIDPTYLGLDQPKRTKRHRPMHHRLGFLARQWPHSADETSPKLAQALDATLEEDPAHQGAWQVVAGWARRDNPDARSLIQRRLPDQKETCEQLVDICADFPLFSGSGMVVEQMSHVCPDSLGVRHLTGPMICEENLSSAAKRLLDLRSRTSPPEPSTSTSPSHFLNEHLVIRAAWNFVHLPSNHHLAEFLRAAAKLKNPYRNLRALIQNAAKKDNTNILVALIELQPLPEGLDRWASILDEAVFDKPPELAAHPIIGPTSDHVRRWISSPLPWVVQAHPYWLVTQWLTQPSELEAAKAAIENLSGGLSAQATSRVSAIMRQIRRTGDSSPCVSIDLVEADIQQALETNRPLNLSVVDLLPDLSEENSDRWFSALHMRGQIAMEKTYWSSGVDQALHFRLQEFTTRLLARLNARPDQWGLEFTVFALLFASPTTVLDTLELQPPPIDPPPRLLANRALLQLLTGAPPAESLPALVETNAAVDFRSFLAHILPFRKNLLNRSAILLQAIDLAPFAQPTLEQTLYESLATILLQESPPAFSTPEAWRQSSLPAPFLEPAMDEPGRAPVLRAIPRLEQIRAFGAGLTLPPAFTAPSQNHGQCLLIIGENGTGKSTLLRAIALALSEPAVISGLLDARAPLLRDGQEGHVTVTLETGTYTVRLHRQGGVEATTVLESPSQEPRPFVLGYGVRRGNALGERDRDPEIGPVGDLHTLFDRPNAMYRARPWLQDLGTLAKLEALRTPGQEGPRQRRWRTVQKAVCDLLRIESLTVDDDQQVWFASPTVGRVRLEALSDGYLTTLGWTVDMMRRWVERQSPTEATGEGDLLREMTGIVLIDEIDLHLHPLWQLEVVKSLRTTFPRMTFIATTHNPLCLQGAGPGEILRLERQGDAVTGTLVDWAPGADVDQVLLDHFGVDHSEDPTTRLLLARHRALLAQGRLDDPELHHLRAQLGPRLGAGGAPPLGPQESHLRARLRRPGG
jgi:energy-coupling factor transporter ATP-binding protein EcfA2